jgi:hypothetical protein
VYEENRRKQIGYFLVAYVFSGLAILTKGLIGFVFPLLIINAWILVTQQWRWLTKMWLLPGLTLITLICLPWFLAEQHVNPHFFNYFFINQHFARYTQQTFNNLQPWWFYLFVTSVGFLPWSLIWPRYSKFTWPFKRKNIDTVYFGLWAIIVLLFFSVPASKLVGYILPIFPPLALLLGRYWDLNWPACERRFKIVAGGSVIFLFGVMTYLPHLSRYSSLPLAAALQANGAQPNERISVYHFYLPDLSFYLQKKLDIVSVWGPPYDLTTDGWKRPFWYAKAWGMDNANMVVEKDFWPLWEQPERQWLIVGRDVADKFIRGAQDHYTLVWHSDRMYLFNNQVVVAKAQNLPAKKVKQATMTMASPTARG